MPETVLEPATAPVRRDQLTRITPEKSRIMNRRRTELKLLREQAKLAGSYSIPAPAPAPAPAYVKPDPFVSAQLASTRTELNRLYQMMTNSRNPLEIDKIASAISKLSVIESNLSGRPGPGTLKPADSKSHTTRASWLLNEDLPGKSPDKPGESGMSEQE